MKTASQAGRRRLWAGALAVIALACLHPAARGGESPEPAQVREEARRLEEKARDLRVAGEVEQAERLMGEARALRAEFEAGVPAGPERPAVAQRRRELQRRMGELKLELKRRLEEGRQEEIDELRDQMERLERELNSLGKRVSPAGEPRRESPPAAERPEVREAQRRLEHLRRAVDSLRAGGMPDMAARLEQAGERLRERLDQGERRRPIEEIERLREEMRELRRGMQEMKRRLEEVARQRSDLDHHHQR